MATNRTASAKHLALVGDELARIEDEPLRIDLTGLTDNRKRKGKPKLPRSIQIAAEVEANQLDFVEKSGEARDKAVERLTRRTHRKLRTTVGAWNELIAELEGEVSEEELQALTVCRKKAVARGMQEHEQDEVTLREVVDQQVAKQLARADFEWRERTLKDRLLGDEAEELGIVTTAGEDLLDVLSLGYTYANRIARHKQEQQRQAALGEVIDAHFEER
jgi:hypothetical protein